MSQFSKNKTDKVSCKFCGDVILQENPTTYEDAVKCYKELPSLLREDESVPVTVWLYPIPKMSTSATNIPQPINMEKKKLVIAALEDLERINVSCNEILWGVLIHLFQKLNTRSISLKDRSSISRGIQRPNYDDTDIHTNTQPGAYAYLYEEDEENNDDNKFDLLSPEAEQKLCEG
ncbi:unnamed protein product [Mytilus edulis]|uniref:Uncharacterized protein n=1 Tax=Mytilus edulis TaxID=6550 RepID=A0A8S3RRG8_MYTED|nr:unnamed protein product [Mytilus edulis]